MEIKTVLFVIVWKRSFVFFLVVVRKRVWRKNCIEKVKRIVSCLYVFHPFQPLLYCNGCWYCADKPIMAKACLISKTWFNVVIHVDLKHSRISPEIQLWILLIYLKTENTTNKKKKKNFCCWRKSQHILCLIACERN